MLLFPTRLDRSIEWPTLAMIVLCYTIWVSAGLLIAPHSLIVALIVMGIASALHSSLQHEILHGHPTKSSRINELLVFLPLAPFFPYRRFKTLHLRHHKDEYLTDPYDDPESFYRDGRTFEQIPKPLGILLKINTTFVGRLTLGPWLGMVAFLCSELRLIIQGNRKIIHAWLIHSVALVLLWFVLERVLEMPLWLYLITSGYLGMSLIAIRTFCEHQAHDEVNKRTAIVERTFLSWLFLNNNLHALHHAKPRLPWYVLPSIYDEEHDALKQQNGNYVYSNYWQIFRRFALTSKENIVHPKYPIPTENFLDDIHTDGPTPIAPSAPIV